MAKKKVRRKIASLPDPYMASEDQAQDLKAADVGTDQMAAGSYVAPDPDAYNDDPAVIGAANSTLRSADTLNRKVNRDMSFADFMSLPKEEQRRIIDAEQAEIAGRRKKVKIVAPNETSNTGL